MADAEEPPEGTPESNRSRPHMIWTPLVIGGVVGLAALAWWIWSGPEAPPRPAPAKAQPIADPAPREAAETPPTASGAPRADYVARIDAALADGRFGEARASLASLEEAFGWSDEVGALDRRIGRYEDAYRRAIRPMLVELGGFEAAEKGPERVFARVLVADRPVATTPWIDPASEGPDGRALLVVRTTLQDGLSVEFLESGGFFGGPDAVSGPHLLAPLASEGPSRFELGSPDGPLTRATATVSILPRTSGLQPDRDAAPIPDGTAAILAALDVALVGSDRARASELLAALAAAAPEHPDLGFLGSEVEALRTGLDRNVARARFVIVEATIDPRADGDTWASGGDRPSFRASVRSMGERLGAAESSKLDPYLDEVEREEPPASNVIEFEARGDAPLRVEIVDTGPTFGTTFVGAVDLDVTLADLPTGSGTLTVERDPLVLIAPRSEENRLRRLVLRWQVER